MCGIRRGLRKIGRCRCRRGDDAARQSVRRFVGTCSQIIELVGVRKREGDWEKYLCLEYRRAGTRLMYMRECVWREQVSEQSSDQERKERERASGREGGREGYTESERG